LFNWISRPGGGKIKQKLLLSALLLLGLIFIFNVNISFATVTPTLDNGIDQVSSDSSNNLDGSYSNVNPTTEKTTFTNGITSNQVAVEIDDEDTSNIADISINLTASNYNPNYMKNVVITITAKNNGPNTAQNLIITNWLNPNYIKWMGDSGKGSYNYKTGIWTVGTLENGTETSLRIAAQIMRSAIILTNYASYKSSSTIDNNTLNNIAGISLKVPLSADIKVTQTASNYYPIYLHHTILTIVVKNYGPNTAQNVTVNTYLDPKIIKYIRDDGKGLYNPLTGNWTIGTLRSGTQVILNIDTKIMVFATNFINLATYTPVTADQSQKNNKAGIVLKVPKLTISTLASSLIMCKKTRYSKAVSIYNWVRDYIEYEFYYNTRYGASGTLKGLKGNCVDISHLLVSLARSAGLSARYKAGYCYFYLSQHWYGHVWVNIYANGPNGLKWYAADASNNNNEFGIIRSWNTSNYELRGVYNSINF
jgi:hypothetical protein